MKSVPQIIQIISRDTSPPLYNLVEHFWFQIFGNGEVAVRSLSFIFFLLAAFFVYKIGEHFWDKKTGLLAGVLTLLNPFFFTYAFEGRMYSIMAFGVVGSMYFFIKKNWPGHVVLTLVALYSHHFAIFAVFVQGLWFLREFFFGKRALALPMFKSFAAIGLLYLPWIIPLYNQTKMVAGGFWLGRPTLTDLKKLIYDYLAKGIPHSLDSLALWTVWATLILRRWGKDVGKTAFLILWFLVPILATWTLSQKFQPIFYNRYLLYTIPAAMLILASNLRKISYPAIALLIAVFIVVDTAYFTHPTKQPFREVAAYVTETKQGDDYLINWNSAAHHLWETKYYKIPGPIFVPAGKEIPFFAGTALMEPTDIIHAIPGKRLPKRVIAITSGPVEEVVLPNYTFKEYRQFGDIKVVWLALTK